MPRRGKREKWERDGKLKAEGGLKLKNNEVGVKREGQEIAKEEQGEMKGLGRYVDEGEKKVTRSMDRRKEGNGGYEG